MFRGTPHLYIYIVAHNMRLPRKEDFIYFQWIVFTRGPNGPNCTPLWWLEVEKTSERTHIDQPYFLKTKRPKKMTSTNSFKRVFIWDFSSRLLRFLWKVSKWKIKIILYRCLKNEHTFCSSSWIPIFFFNTN